MEKLVFILGDVHGDFGRLNEFINRHVRQHAAVLALAEDCRMNGKEIAVDILQCGDFAYFWPRCNSKGLIKNMVDFLAEGRVNIYWCAGNHEDHDELDRLEEAGAASPIEVDEGIFYCPFGSTLALSPDITVLFAGGAESIDKDYRLEKMRDGYPRIWWPQEEISETDMERLSSVPRADWVISHTAPTAFDLFSIRKPYWSQSRKYLDVVLQKFMPKRWFFGHFHEFMKGDYDGVEWECLADMAARSPCWECVRVPDGDGLNGIPPENSNPGKPEAISHMVKIKRKRK